MIDQIEAKEEVLLISTLNHFDQMRTLLNSLSHVQYNNSLELLSGATIGQHVRHIVEFYQCLFLTEKNGFVNYDKRKRDLQLETDKNHVLETLKEITQKVKTASFDHELEIIAAVSSTHNDEIFVKSSLCRELLYNLEHVTHHLAIIKIAIKHYYPSISINSNLGVASSTIKFKNK